MDDSAYWAGLAAALTSLLYGIQLRQSWGEIALLGWVAFAAGAALFSILVPLAKKLGMNGADAPWAALAVSVVAWLIVAVLRRVRR